MNGLVNVDEDNWRCKLDKVKKDLRAMVTKRSFPLR